MASQSSQSLAGKFAKEVSYTSIGVVFTITFATVNTMILARYLVRHDYGVFILLLILTDFLVMLSALGLNTSVIASISSAAEEDKSVIANSVITFRLFTYGIVLVIFYLGQRWFLLLFGESGVVGLGAFVPFMLATAGYRTLLRSILQGYFQFKRMALIDLTTSALNSAMIVAFIVFLKASFTGLVIAQIISQAFACVAFYWAIPGSKRLQLNRGHLRKIIRFGWPLQLNDMIMFVFGNAGGLIVAALMGPGDVALLNIAGRLPAMIRKIFESFRSVYLPNLSKLLADGNRHQAHELLNTSLRLLSFVTSIGAIVAAIFGKELTVLLFSRQYEDSAPLFMIMMIGLNVSLVGNVLGTSLVAGKESKGPAIANTVTGLASLAANVTFIPWLGVVGASFAGSLGSLAANPVNVWLLRRIQIRPNVVIYIRSLVILAVFETMAVLLQPLPWFYSVPVLPLFLVTSYLLSIFTKRDLQLLAAIIASRLPRRTQPSLPTGAEKVEVANR